LETIITESFDESCRKAAEIILKVVADKPCCKLGLATGSTAAAVYPYMVTAFEKGHADFSHVKTINLDEYVGLSVGDPNTYRSSMDRWLFQRANFMPDNTYVADGSVDPEQEKLNFRGKVGDGADLQLLGVGPNGHIGFNEPGDHLISGVHIETLSERTRAVNARFFKRSEDVPKRAITMGVGDILHARRILLLITGKNKLEATRMLLCNEEITTHCPVTLLKLHPAVTVILDRTLAESL
jgi:6-phosphogluconolactonase/Glucosamine-6-phosphate isomerase/deaminase